MVVHQYEKVSDGGDAGEATGLEDNATVDYGRFRCDSAGTEASMTSTASWSSDEDNEEAPPVPLPKPPPDGGWGWMVVVGCVLVGALVPGLFMCFGVFMNAFLVVFPDASKSAASWIPSILNSLMNLMGPVTSLLVNTYSCRSVTLAGGIILSTGLVLSFFTNSIEALYLTYGFLGGVGSGMALSPGLFLISQYFQKRRGVATGVCMAASSAGQIVFPYLLQYLLDEYSYRGCILILGGLTMNTCVSAALYRPLMSKITAVRKSHSKSDVKATKRKHTASQSTFRGSTHSFMAEANSFADLPTTVLQTKLNNNHNDNKKKCGSKKKKKKGTSKKSASSNGKDVLLSAENVTNLNGSAPLLSIEQVILSSRNRSRTLSIESNWVLPGIPEEEHEEEHEETHNLNENKAENETSFEEQEDQKTNKIYLNNNVSSDGSDKLSCSRPLLPQDVTVVVTVVSDDEISGDSLRQFKRQESTDSYHSLSCMHHPFGSVASIPTFEPPSQQMKLPLLARVSKALGFYYFQNMIFYILSMSFTFLVVILSSYTMYMPTYGLSIGLSREESAGLVSIIAMSSMCGRLILPMIPDYVNIKRKYIYSSALLIMSGAVIMTAFADSYPFLLASLVFFGFSSGGSVSISLNVFLEYIPLKEFASFFGLVQLVVGIVVLFSSPLFGLLLDRTGDYTSAYFIMAALGVTSSGILYLDRFAKKLNEPTTNAVKV